MVPPGADYAVPRYQAAWSHLGRRAVQNGRTEPDRRSRQAEWIKLGLVVLMQLLDPTILRCNLRRVCACVCIASALHRHALVKPVWPCAGWQQVRCHLVDYLVAVDNRNGKHMDLICCPSTTLCLGTLVGRNKSVAVVSSSRGLVPSYPDSCNKCHNSIQSRPASATSVLLHAYK